MKKLLLLLFILCLKLIPTKAQWVTIPDTAFVNILTQNYPACMNGNQMDTTCSNILNEDTLYLAGYNLKDITGIAYFDNLIYLDCSSSPVDSITSLPSNLKYLECASDSLTYISYFPNNIKVIKCVYNKLLSLPDLPDSLTVLLCFGNQISALPALPPKLNRLECGSNLLTSLPALPNSLKILQFVNCSVTQLPALPDSLEQLICWFNQLSSLPSIPPSIQQLDVSSNQLTSIPALPDTMYNLFIENNQIVCINNLPNFIIAGNNYASIFSNPLTCVPNQTAYSLGLPLCIDNDIINNPLSCQSLVQISGNVYTDLNNNCQLDINDNRNNNILIKLYDSSNNLIAVNYTVNGIYGFSVSQPGMYKVKIDLSSTPLYISCSQPDSFAINLNAINSVAANLNFPVACNNTIDREVQSIVTSNWISPGQTHGVLINLSDFNTWYNSNCPSTPTSGVVSLDFSGPVTFLAPDSNGLIPIVNGNNLTYNIANLDSLQWGDLRFYLLTDTTAISGDQICFHAEIYPNPLDADTTNNTYDYCYQVTNSYDPNMKEVYPENVLPGYDDWFTYTIHFQNTGTAPAFNIRLRDTLDANLNINTFEIIGYSHPANVTLNGNILTVRYNNIMLPDSTSDYNGSMGYFQYRLKPLPNLPNGTQIENTAYIYFDYNAPIITNTTQNNFDLTVSQLEAVASKNEFVLYPNPSNGVFNFKDTKNLKQVEVYNLLGEQILSQGNQKQINLSGFAKGIYYARINGDVVLKLVKE